MSLYKHISFGIDSQQNKTIFQRIKLAVIWPLSYVIDKHVFCYSSITSVSYHPPRTCLDIFLHSYIILPRSLGKYATEYFILNWTENKIKLKSDPWSGSVTLFIMRHIILPMYSHKDLRCIKVQNITDKFFYWQMVKLKVGFKQQQHDFRIFII